MSQGFVDVVELDAFGSIICVYRLQTGDVSEEWRSCETAENQHRIATFQIVQFELSTVIDELYQLY